MTSHDIPNSAGPNSASNGAGPKAKFVGEENSQERSTPRKDLAAALFLTVFSTFAMVFAWRLPVLDNVLTAPGLLPLLTGLSLLLMGLGLGVKAIRQGAAEAFFRDTGAVVGGYLGEVENRRTLLLASAIFVWIVLVGQISFDLRFKTPVYVFRFSSYEAISIPMLVWILRLFWQASWVRCVAVSMVTIFALATIFRDGFKILLPEAG